MANQWRAAERLAYRLRRALSRSLVFALGLASACQSLSDDGPHELGDGVGSNGGVIATRGGSTGAGGFGDSLSGPGVVGKGGTSPLGFDTTCDSFAESDQQFQRQRVMLFEPLARTLFFWVSAAEAEELRRTRVLLPVTAESRARRGYAFDVLAKYRLPNGSQDPDGQANVDLAQQFSAKLFPSVRSVWPNPWANRLGLLGESQGDQLVQVELEARAWVLVVNGSDLSVVDLSGVPVSSSEASLDPERIGAILFLKHRDGVGGACDAPVTGYREFIVGNESVIEAWSLATPDMRARSESDLAALRSLFVELRTCAPYTFSAEAWNQAAVCAWRFGAPVPLPNYVLSLGLPSSAYQPTPSNMADLIATLEADIPVGEPLTVRPSP